MQPARRLLALSAPWRGLLALALLCTFIASLLDGAILVILVPLLRFLFGSAGSLGSGNTPIEQFMDRMVAPLLAGASPGQALASMTMLLVSAYVLKNAFSYASSQLTVRVQEGLVATLRERLYRHLLQLPLAFFERTRTGMLTTALAGEADQAKGVVSASLVSLFKNVTLVLTTLAVLFTISWQLTLLALACAPPLVLGLRLVVRRLRRHARARSEERAQLNARSTERLSGIRLMRTLGMAEVEADAYGAQAQRYRKRVIRTQRFSSLTGPVSEAFSVGLIVLILYTATHPGLLGLSEPLPANAVLVFLAASLRLMSPLKSIAEFPAQWTTAMASVERVFALLDEPVSEVDPPNALKAGFTRELAYDHVRFSYREGEPVLQDVSFTVKPGEVVALVGPSGAGKTTLVDLLPRLHDPTSGWVLLDGVPTTACSRASVRALLAVVSQDTVLFHDTVHNNIVYGVPGASRAQVEAAARAANADEFINRLPQGYDTVLGERGTRLSGGQRQRVAIARALLRDAPILILDEATSALDAQSEQLVQAAIERLMADRTVLVIAHRLATVRSADFILVLDEGRIVQRGTHAELLAAGGLYRRLYDLQFRDAPEPATAGAGGV